MACTVMLKTHRIPHILSITVIILLFSTFIKVYMFDDLLSDGSKQLVTSEGLLDIFTFQKNEGRLLLDWGAWHGSIFGFNALHILDHQSDDPQTIVNLGILASHGAQIIKYNGKFVNKSTQLTKHMASAQSKFIVALDIDEFILLVNNTNSFVVDKMEILNTFRYLPTDGRRYRMKSVNAMYCPNDTRTSHWNEFSRLQEMTVFSKPLAHLSCRSKTFFLRRAFLGTDQGNHFGKVATDVHDGGYMINGCPYFHSPSIALAHFGEFLPWKLKLEKMIRGAHAYNHTGRAERGEACPPPIPLGPGGRHYCVFWKRLLEIGEDAMRLEYEKKMLCQSDAVFKSNLISEALLKLGLNQRPNG